MYKFKKMLLTNEKLQRLFQESLIRQQKKQEREKKKKALLSLKKIKTREKVRKEEIRREIVFIQKTGEHSSPFNSRDFNVYKNRYIEREIADEDLYTTRHELQEAEKRFEGKINWNIWDKLVKEFREKNEKRNNQNK